MNILLAIILFSLLSTGQIVATSAPANANDVEVSEEEKQTQKPDLLALAQKIIAAAKGHPVAAAAIGISAVYGAYRYANSSSATTEPSPATSPPVRAVNNPPQPAHQPPARLLLMPAPEPVPLALPAWQQSEGLRLNEERKEDESLDPYKLLGLQASASAQAIQKAANTKIALHLHALNRAQQAHDEDAYQRQLRLLQLTVHAAENAGREERKNSN